MKKTLKQTRRIAAILLSMCLVFAMMPAAAFADTQGLEVTVTKDKKSENFPYDNGKVNITSSGSYSISMAENATTTTDSIEIGNDLVVTLSLNNVSIDLSSKGGEEEKEDGKYVALKIGEGAKVNLEIGSGGTLKSGRASAGIELAENAELTITSFGRSYGILTVAGGGSGAE